MIHIHAPLLLLPVPAPQCMHVPAAPMAVMLGFVACQYLWEQILFSLVGGETEARGTEETCPQLWDLIPWEKFWFLDLPEPEASSFLPCPSPHAEQQGADLFANLLSSSKNSVLVAAAPSAACCEHCSFVGEQCFPAQIPHPLIPTFIATGFTLCFA